MATLTQTLGHIEFDAPRSWWRRALDRLLALDLLHRERHDMAALDDRILRDIGVSRADVETALSRPEQHLRLILSRGDQLQH